MTSNNRQAEAFNSDDAFARIAILLKKFDYIDSQQKLFAALNQIAEELCPEYEMGAPKSPMPPPLLIHPAVINELNKELKYQNDKWGADHISKQTIEGHLLIMRKELDEAENGWVKNLTGRNSTISELRQVVCVGLQALNNLQNDSVNI